MKIGECEFFNTKPWIELSDILVAADEPLLALKVLDMVPAYYRDHIPMDMLRQKQDILSLLATPAFYATNKWDKRILDDDMAVSALENTLRGRYIYEDVLAFNKKDKVPHILDLGPGEYWLPIALKAKGLNFTYDDVGLCPDAKLLARDKIGDRMKEHPDPDQPVIYVACEIIEHLHHEHDLAVELYRKNIRPNIIHLSTPKYTWDGSAKRLNWRSFGDLGHLRTYTPQEFFVKVSSIFPEYELALDCVNGGVMHIRGAKR